MMNRKMVRLLLLALITAAEFARPLAAEARDFCPARPGLTTPPCVVERGRPVVEAGLVDWQRSNDSDTRSDDLTFGSLALRLGIAERAEVEVDWTAYQHQRVRDLVSGVAQRRGGTGDITLAVKRAFGTPDGPAAVRAFVTLPVGTGPGAGTDWTAGIMIPLQFDLGHGVTLALTPEIDSAANEQRSGHHVGYGSAAGVSVAVTKDVTLAVDAAVFRQDDPDGAHTDRTLGASLAWMAGENTQFDAGGIIGVGGTDPAVGLYVGIACRF